MSDNNKYIIYLHPKHSTPMYFAFEKYWKKVGQVCKKIGCENYAEKYPYHVTLTGFFYMTPSDIKNFKEKFKNIMKQKYSEIDEFKFYRNSYAAFLSLKHPQLEKNIKLLIDKTEINPKTGYHFTLYGPVSETDAKIIERECSDEIKKILETKFTDMEICLWTTDKNLKKWDVLEII